MTDTLTDEQAETEAAAPAEQLTHNGRPCLWNADGYMVPPEEGTLHADELLRRAGLDWDIRLERMQTESGHDAGKLRAITRADTGHVLGIARSRFRPYMNSQVFTFLDTLVDSSEALYEGAWQWAGGEKIGVLMRLPQEAMIAEFDPHQVYLYAQIGHTGGTSFRVGAFMERLSCTNMVNGLLRGANYQFRAVHSSSMNAKVAQAREALSLTFKISSDWDELVKRMLDKPATDVFVKNVVEKIWPKNEKRLELALKNFKQSPTIPDTVRMTRYGAYCSLTETSEWLIPRNPSFSRSMEGAALVERSRILEVCSK